MSDFKKIPARIRRLVSSMPDALSIKVLKVFGGKYERAELMYKTAAVLEVKKNVDVMAVIAELIYACYIIHSEIKDTEPGGNGVSGNNKMSILAGDLLFSQALKQMLNLENQSVREYIFALMKNVYTSDLELNIALLKSDPEKGVLNGANGTAGIYSLSLVLPGYAAGLPEVDISFLETWGSFYGRCRQLSGEGKGRISSAQKKKLRALLADLPSAGNELQEQVQKLVSKKLSRIMPASFKV